MKFSPEIEAALRSGKVVRVPLLPPEAKSASDVSWNASGGQLCYAIIDGRFFDLRPDHFEESKAWRFGGEYGS